MLHGLGQQWLVSWCQPRSQSCCVSCAAPRQHNRPGSMLFCCQSHLCGSYTWASGCSRAPEGSFLAGREGKDVSAAVEKGKAAASCPLDGFCLIAPSDRFPLSLRFLHFLSQKHRRALGACSFSLLELLSVCKGHGVLRCCVAPGLLSAIPL